MRKLLVGLASSVLIAGGLTSVASANAATKTVNCTHYLRSSTAHHNDGSTGDDEWTIKYAVGFKYCKDSNGPNWAKPEYSIGMYNQEGTRMNCNVLTGTNVLLYVRFDPYMWSSNGANFNPSSFKVPCDESTYHQTFKIHTDPPRLYYANGTYPKWKANWEIEKSGVLFEGDGTLSGDFRPCSGVGTSPCS